MATIQTTRNIPNNRKRSNNHRIVAISKSPLLLVVLVSAFLSSTAPSLFRPHSSSSSMQRGMVAAKAATSTVSHKAKQAFKLLLKKKLSHDSFWLRYGLPEGRTFLGTDALLPTCIKIDYQPSVEGHRALSKSYTPVSHPNQNGYFDLVVKSYPYEEGGGVGKYLCDMEVGSSIQAKLKGERMMHGSSVVVGRGWRHIGLVAGGTGIAPLLQIARIALESESERPQVHLLFVNHTRKDILGKEEIEALAKEHPDHFVVTYSFTREDESMTTAEGEGECSIDGSNSNVARGRGDAVLAGAALPKPSSSIAEGESTDTMVLVCGRDGFVAHWAGPVGRAKTEDGSKGPKIQGPLLGVLAEAGFTADQVFKY
jgi:cytochrome-b5 reductase